MLILIFRRGLFANFGCRGGGPPIGGRGVSKYRQARSTELYSRYANEKYLKHRKSKTFKIRRPHRGQQAVRVLPVGSPWSPSLLAARCVLTLPPPILTCSGTWRPYFAALGPKYTTLGPKFYIFSVLSPRICFCFVNPYFLAGIAAFVEILLLAVSKHVLKRS